MSISKVKHRVLPPAITFAVAMAGNLSMVKSFDGSLLAEQASSQKTRITGNSEKVFNLGIEHAHAMPTSLHKIFAHNVSEGALLLVKVSESFDETFAEQKQLSVEETKANLIAAGYEIVREQPHGDSENQTTELWVRPPQRHSPRAAPKSVASRFITAMKYGVKRHQRSTHQPPTASDNHDSVVARNLELTPRIQVFALPVTLKFSKPESANKHWVLNGDRKVASVQYSTTEGTANVEVTKLAAYPAHSAHFLVPILMRIIQSLPDGLLIQGTIKGLQDKDINIVTDGIKRANYEYRNSEIIMDARGTALLMRGLRPRRPKG